MFIAQRFFSFGISPEDFGIGSAAYTVHVVHIPAADIVVGIFTSAGMDQESFVAQGRFQEVGAGGTDTAHGLHIL